MEKQIMSADYTNYQTLGVALWVNNDPRLCQHKNELVASAVKSDDPENTLAKALQDWFEEDTEPLQCVKWHELAKVWIKES